MGDTLTVKATHQGEADRRGKIIEIHGKDGEPPYLVRWQDEHESLFFPAPAPWWNITPPAGSPSGTSGRDAPRASLAAACATVMDMTGNPRI